MHRTDPRSPSMELSLACGHARHDVTCHLASLLWCVVAHRTPNRSGCGADTHAKKVTVINREPVSPADSSVPYDLNGLPKLK